MTCPPKPGLWSSPEPAWTASSTDHFDILCEPGSDNEALVECYRSSLEETNSLMVDTFGRPQTPHTRVYIVDPSLRGLSRGAAFTTAAPGDDRLYVLSFPSLGAELMPEPMMARVRAIVRHEVTHLYNWQTRPPLKDSSLGWRLLDQASALYMAHEKARTSLSFDCISLRVDLHSEEEKLLLMRCIVDGFGLEAFFQFWDRAPESEHPYRALAEQFGLRWLDLFALNAPRPEAPRSKRGAPHRVSDCLLFEPTQIPLTNEVATCRFTEHLDEHSRHYHEFLIVHDRPATVKVSASVSGAEPTLYVGAFTAVRGARGFQVEPSLTRWALWFRSQRTLGPVRYEASTHVYLSYQEKETRLIVIVANLSTKCQGSRQPVEPKATDYELELQLL